VRDPALADSVYKEVYAAEGEEVLKPSKTGIFPVVKTPDCFTQAIAPWSEVVDLSPNPSRFIGKSAGSVTAWHFDFDHRWIVTLCVDGEKLWMFDNTPPKAFDMMPCLANQFLPPFHVMLDESALKVVQKKGDVFVVPSFIHHKVLYYSDALNVDVSYDQPHFCKSPDFVRRNDDLFYGESLTKGYSNSSTVKKILAGRSIMPIRAARWTFEISRIFWWAISQPFGFATMARAAITGAKKAKALNK